MLGSAFVSLTAPRTQSLPWLVIEKLAGSAVRYCSIAVHSCSHDNNFFYCSTLLVLMVVVVQVIKGEHDAIADALGEVSS